MTKLEKSIRHELAYYGPSLRAGHYEKLGTTGTLPKRGYLNQACADIEDGIVTDIRIYTVGDARERRDFYGESCDITSAFDGEYGYLSYWDWDVMIAEIIDLVQQYDADQDK